MQREYPENGQGATPSMTGSRVRRSLGEASQIVTEAENGCSFRGGFDKCWHGPPGSRTVRKCRQSSSNPSRRVRHEGGIGRNLVKEEGAI